MKKQYLLWCAVATVFGACTGNANKAPLDTPTSGKVTIAVDESLKPLVDAEIAVFESFYNKAKITVNYVSEGEAVLQLLQDTARLAIVTRTLSKEEEEALKSQTYVPRYIDMAYDGITFILNKNNTDSIFTTGQLREILLGNTSDWSQAGSKRKGKINVVFDNARSGAIRYLRDSLLNGKELGKNCFAVNSNPDVISYVEQHPDAIGIIGSAWISDQDDSTSESFLEAITVANVVPYNPETAQAPSMKPYQAYIALKQYPFWRKIVIISRESRAGLGTGFASFIASDQGQRIILKAGIVPATAPVRIINAK